MPDHRAARVAMLAAVPLLASLPRRQLVAIADAVAEWAVPAGSDITVEGSAGVGFFIVTAGSARVTIGGTAVRQLGPGDHFGDIALLTGRDRTATVTAISDLHCLVLTAWDFHHLVWSQPGVAAHVLTETTARLLDQTRDLPNRTGDHP